MGLNFGGLPGDKGSMLNNIASSIGSFIRSQKTTGADSATGANSLKNIMKTPADEFKPMLEMTQEAQQQEDVDFKAETEKACEWAEQQSLAEAVDHFQNEEVGNGLMLMSIVE